MDKNNVKTVYLVRHGESTENIEPVFQSDDSTLTANGKQQAHLVAAKLATMPVEVLLSSPTQRARETAEIIAGATNKDILYSPLFVEKIKASAISGKPYADPDADALWREAEESIYTPGLRVQDAENYDDIIRRVDDALKLLQDRDENSIVVVTHGYFLRTIVARVLLRKSITGEGLRNIHKAMKTRNTSITTLRFAEAFEEGAAWRLEAYNNFDHLIHR